MRVGIAAACTGSSACQCVCVCGGGGYGQLISINISYCISDSRTFEIDNNVILHCASELGELPERARVPLYVQSTAGIQNIHTTCDD